VTAESEDGVVMAIEHRTLPLAAVQFHPESIMTLGDEVGLRLLDNVMRRLAGRT
jgi:anthranilate synthase